MNDSELPEDHRSSMSDEALIGELQHWGEKEPIGSSIRVSDIQRKSNEQSRKTLRMAMVAGSLLITAALSVVWFTKKDRQVNSPVDVAMEPIDAAIKKGAADLETEPERLLQSVAERTQAIGSRLEVLTFQSEQQRQATRELEELQSRLLDYKRAAIRNRIALREVP